MKFLLPLLLLVGASFANEIYNQHQIIDQVNKAKPTWQAGPNFSDKMPLGNIKAMLGHRPNKKGVLDFSGGPYTIADNEIPAQFDARKKWPNCPSIKHIRDQGVCGSCWAVATASAFSDRVCISTKGKFTKPLTAQLLLACCSHCGAGCNGGEEVEAWKFFKETGLVTGGDYHSHVGCQPYQIQPCQHHSTGKRPACDTLPAVNTPKCAKRCLNPFFHQRTFKEDHVKASKAYALPKDVKTIQKEILQNGPVAAGFTVYEDFPVYKKGVYHHVSGNALGGHAVRIIGWGTEGGVPYWLVANSWNSDWGDKGTFKIKRGNNECGIEEEMTAGIPAPLTF